MIQGYSISLSVYLFNSIDCCTVVVLLFVKLSKSPAADWRSASRATSYDLRTISFFFPQGHLLPPVTMASLSSALPAWRSIAPRLSKDLFTCRQCLRNQGFAVKSVRRFAAVPSPKPSMTRSSLFTDKNRQFFTSSLRRSVAAPTVGAVAEEAAAKAKSSFPKISDKAVAYWLLGSAASVFGIVVFGGLTRLTESGFVYLVNFSYSRFADRCFIWTD
jgi:hypothetical protein